MLRNGFDVRLLQADPSSFDFGGGAVDPSPGPGSDPNWLASQTSAPAGGGGLNTDIFAPAPQVSGNTGPLNTNVFQGYTPSTATAAPAAGGGGGGNTWLSDLGALVPAAVGLYEGGRATRNVNQLTAGIAGTGASANQYGSAITNQLLGKGQAPGPIGTLTAGQTTAAGTLANTANTYASGQLTPAQQLQVKNMEQGANAEAMTALSTPGGKGGAGLDSSFAKAVKQQNSAQAQILAQQLQIGNIQLAQQALTAVNSTITSITNNALNASGLGLSATQAAVMENIRANAAVAQQQQQLMQGIVQGIIKSGQGGGLVAGAGSAASGVANLASRAGTAISDWWNKPTGQSSITPTQQEFGSTGPYASAGLAQSGVEQGQADLSSSINTDLSNMPAPDFQISDGSGG